MPLEEVYLTPKNITRGLDIFRDMKSLAIGIPYNHAWPAAEFWERLRQGGVHEIARRLFPRVVLAASGQTTVALGPA